MYQGMRNNNGYWDNDDVYYNYVQTQAAKSRAKASDVINIEYLPIFKYYKKGGNFFF